MYNAAENENGNKNKMKIQKNEHEKSKETRNDNNSQDDSVNVVTRSLHIRVALDSIITRNAFTSWTGATKMHSLAGTLPP